MHISGITMLNCINVVIAPTYITRSNSFSLCFAFAFRGVSIEKRLVYTSASLYEMIKKTKAKPIIHIFNSFGWLLKKILISLELNSVISNSKIFLSCVVHFDESVIILFIFEITCFDLVELTNFRHHLYQIFFIVCLKIFSL